MECKYCHEPLHTRFLTIETELRNFLVRVAKEQPPLKDRRGHSYSSEARTLYAMLAREDKANV